MGLNFFLLMNRVLISHKVFELENKKEKEEIFIII